MWLSGLAFSLLLKLCNSYHDPMSGCVTHTILFSVAPIPGGGTATSMVRRWVYTVVANNCGDMQQAEIKPRGTFAIVSFKINLKC